MKDKFPITATFIDEITYDIPSSNWTDEQWAQDLDNMKEVGIDTVVLIRGWFDGKCVYPSKIFPTLKKENEDFAGLIFREAAKRDMNVFMGMYISNIKWNDGDYKNEIEMNKLFVDEVVSRYGDIPSFGGWYIPHETSKNTLNIASTMGGLAALCKDKTPEKKVLISPFFKTSITDMSAFSAERTVEEWSNIWRDCGADIDICAFQDGTVSLEEYGAYFSAMKQLCESHGISLWANVELFERDPRQVYYPISFDLLRRKIELAQQHVDNCLSFE